MLDSGTYQLLKVKRFYRYSVSKKSYPSSKLLTSLLGFESYQDLAYFQIGTQMEETHPAFGKDVQDHY
jgi:hypothetical protein